MEVGGNGIGEGDYKNTMANQDNAANGHPDVSGILDNVITELARIMQVPQSKLVYWVGGILCLFVMFNYGSLLLTNAVGIVYPAYQTVKSIEGPEGIAHMWLCYWLIFVSLGVFQLFFESVMVWMPLYSLFKIAFLVWCMAPHPNNGSVYIYNRFIQPAFHKYNPQIDQCIESMSVKAKAVVQGAMNE